MSSEPIEITWEDIFGNEVKTETYDLNKKTGKEVTTTPEDFMKHIAEDIKKYQEFQKKLAKYEEEDK